MSTKGVTLTPAAWRAWHQLASRSGFTYRDAAGEDSPALNDLWEEIGRNASLLTQIGHWLRAPSSLPTPAQVAPEESGAPLVVIRPKAPLSGAIAYVRCHGQASGWQMHITFAEKLDGFRAVVKGALFGWNKDYEAWVRHFAPEAEPAQRAAEICHRLLLAGFCVSPPSLIVGQRALSADYTPESRRWVSANTTDDHLGTFVFRWWRAEDCYHAVMELPGARYRGDGAVHVPAEYADEVLDFAGIHNFALTDKALRLVERARLWLSLAMLVDELPDVPTQSADQRPDFSDLDAEIDPHLLDDEE